MKKSLIFSLLVSIALISCERINLKKDYKIVDVEQTNIKYQIKKDLGYGDISKGQNFDVYIPEEIEEKMPVFLMFHSGGWIAGDKQFNNSMIDYFMQKNLRCVIVNANYRLASNENISYPQQLDDIDLLIAHLKSNSDLYKIDNKFFLMGFSSGGHLAMLYSYKKNNSEIKAVGGIVAPTDLTDENIHTGVLKEEVKYMMKKPFDQQSLLEYQQASPIFNINKNAPPTIVFYGGLDYTIPKSQGEKLVEKLNANIVKNELILMPNEQHNWDNIPETLDAIIQFVDLYI